MTAARSSRELIAEARRRIREVLPAEAEKRLAAPDAPVLIDVRDEYEHEIERLGGSLHVSRGTLEMRIEHEFPDRETELLLYCASGDRSALAAWTLVGMGYRRVASLAGGLHAWRDQGLPTILPQAVGGEGSGI